MFCSRVRLLIVIQTLDVKVDNLRIMKDTTRDRILAEVMLTGGQRKHQMGIKMDMTEENDV